MLGGLTPRVNFSAKPIQNWWETHIFQCKTLTKLVKPIQNWWETQIFQCKTLTKLVNNTNFLVENRPPLSSQASKSMILVIESSHRNPPPDSSQTHVDIQIWDPNSSSVQLCEGQERFRIAQQLHTTRIWTPVQTKAPIPHSYQCSGSWQKPLHPDDKRNSGVGDVGNHQDALLSIPLCQPRGICKPTILQRNSRQQSDCKLSFIRNWSANCRIWTPVGTSRIHQLSYSAGAHRCTCPAGWNRGRVVI